MPLPSVEKYGAKQCAARSKRTKEPCKNAAAYGCNTCRYHGARRSRSALSGIHHPQYKSGEFTKEEKALRSHKSLQFLMLEKLGWHIDLFAEGSTKIRGRKPNGYPYNLTNLHDDEQLAKAIELSLNQSKKEL
jgi:hypothetical protein